MSHNKFLFSRSPQYLVEAMEILEMFCDLILARFGLVTQLKELDDGIAEAVSSIIWVSFVYNFPMFLEPNYFYFRSHRDFKLTSLSSKSCRTCSHQSMESHTQTLVAHLFIRLTCRRSFNTR